ncbi:hypothetical protein HIM_09693 [Hirsutella minnesotensis 3608]|uniref:Uncharacterized protein n=1 Tax=Hirsutella minnesotensis 3608 TaxID=1043627 RepID=A0A0F7ZL27_9HYPO|nr:hypothetical protein HIM_09693 [Hirsutella minnesotensis 3608]
MPSLVKACVALVGSISVVQALPASGVSYTNSTSRAHGEQVPANSTTHVPIRPVEGCNGRNCSSPGQYGSAQNITGDSWPAKNQSRTDQGSGPTGSRENQPLTTLLPSTHWSVDKSASDNLKPILPGQAARMHYGNDDPTKAGQYASLTYYFKSQSVNLDHSHHITVSKVEGDKMTVTFEDQEAFEHASNTWSTDDGLILITYTKGCGNYEMGERCYFDVADLDVHSSADSRKIVVHGEYKHPDDITTGGETEWGWWSPGEQDNSSGHSQAQGAESGFEFSSSPSSGPDSNTASLHGEEKKLQSPTDAKKTGPCVAPADAKYGLPTACLGDFFDLDLDNKIGYEPLDDKSKRMLSDLAPHSGISGRIQRRDDDRWSWSSIWSGNPIKNIAVKVYETVAEAISFSGSVNKQFTWALPDPANKDSPVNKLLDIDARRVSSPWGDAILLKSFGAAQPEGNLTKHLNVYCVDCGVKGKARVGGRAAWNMLNGITEGTVEFNMDMSVALKIGVDAQVSFKGGFDSDLLRVGLPALSYGVVSISPQVSVSAHAGLEAAAKGRLLAGAEMGVRDSRITVDLINSTNSERAGLAPYFTPVFEVEGELMVSASLALPVGLECGVQVSKWHKVVSIVDEPSVKGVAQVAATVGLSETRSFTAGFKEKDGCTGVSTQLSWRNKVYLNLIDLKTFSLSDTGDRPLARNCLWSSPTKEASAAASTAVPAGFKREVQLMLPTEPIVDLTSEFANEGSDFAVSSSQSLDVVPYREANGFRYTRLVGAKGNTVVMSCSNGNLYAARADGERNPDCSELFPVGDDDLVAFDGAQKIMQYDNNTMSKLGVSRLRLRSGQEVTKSGVAVVLGLYTNTTSQDSYYLAVNPDGQVFYPVVCDYEDKNGPKVFLASDPDSGVDMLSSQDVRLSITGGAVRECHPLAISSEATDKQEASASYMKLGNTIEE